jgi:hypothetical protein
MSALSVLVVKDVTADRFTRIEAAAKEKFGEAFSGDSGVAKKRGVEISYSYDGANLTLSFLSLPSLFGHFIKNPNDAIAELNKWIESIQ